MKVYEGSEVRNVALIGHGHSGKTSLAAGMLYTSGAGSRLTRVDEGNTVTDFDDEEIQRKLAEYFEAGVRLVWVVRPRLKCVDVYTSLAEFRRVMTEQSLDGGDVLPGFRLPLRKLFGK